MEIVKGIIVILGFVCTFTYPIVELIKDIKRRKRYITLLLNMNDEYIVLLMLAQNVPKWMPRFLKNWWINRQLRKIKPKESSDEGIDDEYG